MKKDEREKEEKLAGLLKDAESHPMMKAILAEKAAAVLATRTEAVGKIEVVNKERDEVIPKLQADLEAKEAKYKKAKVALDAAGGEFQKARAALSIKGQVFDNQISKQAQILIESADPLIDETIIFFREKLDWLRSPGRISRNAAGSERNIFTEKITVKEESNADAIHAALSYCMAAIAELERMKLTVVLDTGKIEELKKGIPKIDEYREYQGARSMPKGPDGAFLAKLSNEFDAKIQQLLNK